MIKPSMSCKTRLGLIEGNNWGKHQPGELETFAKQGCNRMDDMMDVWLNGEVSMVQHGATIIFRGK